MNTITKTSYKTSNIPLNVEALFSIHTNRIKGDTLCLCIFVSFTCNVCTYAQTYLDYLPAKIFRSIVVIDSDTVVCGSNMLLRLAKYTVDMTRTMARLGILFRQLTNMDTISSPSSDQQPSQYKYTLNTSQPGDRTFQSSF